MFGFILLVDVLCWLGHKCYRICNLVGRHFSQLLSDST